MCRPTGKEMETKERESCYVVDEKIPFIREIFKDRKGELLFVPRSEEGSPLCSWL
jgi:hypothetical protein